MNFQCESVQIYLGEKHKTFPVIYKGTRMCFVSISFAKVWRWDENIDLCLLSKSVPAIIPSLFWEDARAVAFKHKYPIRVAS